MSVGRLTIPYQFRFDRGAATGRAELVVFDGRLWNLVLRFAWVEIEGEDGSLRFPPVRSTPP